jgi:hypothetical protein
MKNRNEKEKKPFSQSPAHAPSDNLKGKKEEKINPFYACPPAQSLACFLRSVDRYTLYSSTPQRYGSKNTRSSTSICTVNNYPGAARSIKEKGRKKAKKKKKKKKNSSRMTIMLKKLPWDIRKGITPFYAPANAHTQTAERNAL